MLPAEVGFPRVYVEDIHITHFWKISAGWFPRKGLRSAAPGSAFSAEQSTGLRTLRKIESFVGFTNVRTVSASKEHYLWSAYVINDLLTPFYLLAPTVSWPPPTCLRRNLSTPRWGVIANMALGKGVAANEALCENIFVLLVSVLNSIPVFVVGKPGSSKSLAVSVLLANLRGRGSANPFLRTFPAVEAFFHQCSPQSTSQGILEVGNDCKNALPFL